MSERLGFALVLLIAIASVASLLFSGASPTANIVAGQPKRGIAIDECVNIRCPGHGYAEAMLDTHGRVMHQDNGKAVCVCPFR